MSGILHRQLVRRTRRTAIEIRIKVILVPSYAIVIRAQEEGREGEHGAEEGGEEGHRRNAQDEDETGNGRSLTSGARSVGASRGGMTVECCLVFSPSHCTSVAQWTSHSEGYIGIVWS